MSNKQQKAMGYAVTRYLNFILKYTKVWAFLGTVWFIYSMVVTLDFLRQMDETVTPNDRAAITEAGVLAALVGNCIVTFCLTLQMMAFSFYNIQISVTPKGDMGHLAMREAAATAIQLSDTPAETGSSTQTTTVV